MKLSSPASHPLLYIFEIYVFRSLPRVAHLCQYLWVGVCLIPGEVSAGSPGHRSEFMSSNPGLISNKADKFLCLYYAYFQTQAGGGGGEGIICGFLSLHWTLIIASGSAKEEQT